MISQVILLLFQLIWEIIRLNEMKKVLSVLFLMIFATMQIISAQERDGIICFGGITDYNHEVLDSASIGVFYSFEQKVYKIDRPVIILDTILLAIGKNISVSFDFNYKAKEQLRAGNNLANTRKAGYMNAFDSDAIESVLELKQKGKEYAEYYSGEPVYIYKDHIRDLITSYLFISPGYLCEQSRDDMSRWDITGEEMVISGYKCFKATIEYAGRLYTAWYTPDIPLSEGPWKFCGLPGLILKVTDDDGIYCYEMIGLERYGGNVQITVDDRPRGYEKCNLKQFNRVADSARSKVQISAFVNGQYWVSNEYPYSFIPMEL